MNLGGEGNVSPQHWLLFQVNRVGSRFCTNRPELELPVLPLSPVAVGHEFVPLKSLFTALAWGWVGIQNGEGREGRGKLSEHHFQASFLASFCDTYSWQPCVCTECSRTGPPAEAPDAHVHLDHDPVVLTPGIQLGPLSSPSCENRSPERGSPSCDTPSSRPGLEEGTPLCFLYIEGRAETDTDLWSHGSVLPQSPRRRGLLGW